MAAAVAYLLSAPTRYTATAHLLVTGSGRAATVADDDSVQTYLPREVVQTYVQIVAAPSVVRELANSLPPGLAEVASDPARSLLSHVRGRLPWPVDDSSPVDEGAAPNHSQQHLQKTLAAQLEVAQQGMGSVVAVSFTADGPELAADLANRYVGVALDQEQARAAASRQEARRAMDETLASLEARLRQERDEVARFRENHNQIGRASCRERV